MNFDSSAIDDWSFDDWTKDLVFVIDASQRMQAHWSSLRDALFNFVRPLRELGEVRLGLLAQNVTYDALTDEYVHNSKFIGTEGTQGMAALRGTPWPRDDLFFTGSESAFCTRFDEIRCRSHVNMPFALKCALDFPFYGKGMSFPDPGTQGAVIAITETRLEDVVGGKSVSGIGDELRSIGEQYCRQHISLFLVAPSSDAADFLCPFLGRFVDVSKLKHASGEWKIGEFCDRMIDFFSSAFKSVS